MSNQLPCGIPSSNLFSRQIRPPIYSLKQTKLRKRRVVRFAILYFAMLVLFLVLLVAPLVARDMNVASSLKDLGIPMRLLQPLDPNNNDTAAFYTGNGVPKGFRPISSGPFSSIIGASATVYQ